MTRMRSAGLAASAAVLALTLSGCSVVEAFTPSTQAAIFDSVKEFKASDTAKFGSPGFVPDDATTIRVDWDPKAGTAILTYSSKTHFKAGTCTKEAAVPKPAIQDSWWPVDGFPAKGSDCSGGWSAFVIGNQVWAALAKG